MYARVTLLELDTVRMDLGTAVERFRAQVLPVLREQPGYEGLYVLATEEGRALLMSLWQSEKDAEASVRSGYYGEQISKFGTVFRAPPGREGYDVVVADFPATVMG
jgi:heme-degrading monooxygenase HmoA